MAQVTCPICSESVLECNINRHIDTGCSECKMVQGPSQGKCHTVTKFAPIFSKSRDTKPPTGTLSNMTDTPTAKKRKVDASILAKSPLEKHTKVPGLSATGPLAEQLRPQRLSEFVGQRHIIGPGSPLINMLESGKLGGIIFWGPPGCGKTTLSRLLAREAGCTFKELSATSSGINDVRSVFEEAKGLLAITGKRTILFLDEIHRFNKAQQDIFLPYIEQGQIQMIGATTENPSFKLTGALISRCRVFVLDRLTDEDVRNILTSAVARISCLHDSPITVSSLDAELPSCQDPASTSQALNQPEQVLFPSFPQLTPRILSSIVSLCCGDARTALSLLELATYAKFAHEDDIITSLRRSVSVSYDRSSDSRYDMISALHKSVRGSQGSAAMYWLARMLTAGEDPVYIARRMVVCASEDIGLADSQALPLAVATLHACQQIGMPECRINLAHLVAYLSEAPKSIRAYEAYNRAEEAAKLDPSLPVPMAVRNAPTTLMKELGYSEGYKYNPTYAHPVHDEYLPMPLRDKVFLRDDNSDKIWDEAALSQWERECNGGHLWSGRP